MFAFFMEMPGFSVGEIVRRLVVSRVMSVLTLCFLMV